MVLEPLHLRVFWTDWAFWRAEFGQSNDPVELARRLKIQGVVGIRAVGAGIAKPTKAGRLQPGYRQRPEACREARQH